MLSNYRTVEQQERQQIKSRLESAKFNFKNRFENRSYYLAAFAETAAKDFGMKQVFEEDTRSFLVALNNHRKRINADIAMAVKTDGIVVGQLVNAISENQQYKIRVGSQQGKPFGHMGWFESLQENYLYSLDKTIYQLSFSPLKSGDLIIGWVGFGYSINESLAKSFSELTGLTTQFGMSQKDGWQLLSSSANQPSAQQPSQQRQLLNLILTGRQPKDVVATTYPMGLANNQKVVAVMYGLRDDLLMTIRGRWQELSVFTLITLLLSLAGAYWIAANISRPVKLLEQQTKEIANGNYDRNIQFSSKDELGQLALEFDQMKGAILSREQTISQQAFQDALTGLPNRLQLARTINKMVKDEKLPFAIISFGPQRLDDVNYSLGHSVGDQVIKKLSERLISISEPNLLFKLGGSTFVLLVKNTEREQMKNWLEKIMHTTDLYFVLNDISLHIQLQLGIAMYPEDDDKGNSLIEKAGTALQYAKTNQLNQFFYEHSLSELIKERLQLINGLKQAIENNQLVLFYQPKLDIKRNVITEVEALIRWQHPTQGMIPPDKFIELAEKTGHIHQLTQWVLETALAQYIEWKKLNIHLAIAINISAESLKYPDFYDKVVATLKSYGLPPKAICLEITESVVVDDPKAAITLLAKFQQNGFRLSIDDYGTGYSSLEQLKQLPVCEIKIDKAFVMNLLDHKFDQVIVKSTIDMAHSLGLGIVAEGVENQTSLEWLAKQGCEMAQGYFISRPKPGGELTDWLMQSKYYKCLNNFKPIKANY